MNLNFPKPKFAVIFVLLSFLNVSLLFGQAPTITSLTPTKARVGETVHINGTGFYGGSSSSAVATVSIGGVIVPTSNYTVIDDRNIDAVLASGTYIDPTSGAQNNTQVSVVINTSAGGTSTGTSSSTFTFNPMPYAGGNQTFACSASSAATVTLSGTLPATGNWIASVNNTVKATLSTTSNGVATVTLPTASFVGVLEYVYTIGNGLRDSMSITISGPLAPVLEVHSGSTALCPGSTVQLCPLPWGFSNFQWYKDGTAITGAAGVSSCITINTSGIGSYTLKGTDGSACWSNASAAVNVTSISSLPIPTITVLGSTAVCAGGTTTLSSSATSGNLWFKNGNSTGATSQTYTVSDSATYSVLVSGGSCTPVSSVGKIITSGITAAFTANATPNGSSQCDNTIQVFTGASSNTDPTIINSWDFGVSPTQVVTTKGASHTYPQPGTGVTSQPSYQVTHTVSNSGNCTDVSIQTVYINICPSPTSSCTIIPGFIINNTGGNDYAFTDTSTITSSSKDPVTITKLDWAIDGVSVGNGSPFTKTFPTLATNQTHNIVLTVTGNLGCINTATTLLSINVPCPVPAASFTTDKAVQCATGNNFTFTNTSNNSSATMSYALAYGDGTKTSLASGLSTPPHSYTNQGTYSVTLFAINTCANATPDTATVTTVVTVNDVPPTPDAITGPTTVVVYNNIALVSGPSGGQWSSSDLNLATVDAYNGTVTGVSVGSPKISYTLSNGCGVSKVPVTTSITVTPACVPPTANISIISPGNTSNVPICFTNNAAFSFDASKSVGSDPTPNATWYFGDASSPVTTTTINASPVVTHTYAAAATYKVTLVVSNSCGSDNVTDFVTINTAPPATLIVGASTVEVGNNITLSSPTDPSVAVTNSTWTSADITVASFSSSSIPAQLTGNKVGTTLVTNTLTNTCGTSPATTTTITVILPANAVAVDAEFTYVSTNCLTSGSTPSCTFDGSTSTGYTTSSNTLNYSWDFGDGTPHTLNSTIATATHAYKYPNTYTVTLTVTDAYGITGTKQQLVSVGGTKIVSSFNILSNTGSGFDYTFISTSTVNTGSMTYAWSFGDGTTATGANPTKTYAAISTGSGYSITLAVTSGGCTSTTSPKYLIVTKVAPVITPVTNTPGTTINLLSTYFTYSGAPCSASGQATSYKFTATNTNAATGVVTYLWDFGDGVTSTVTAPTHIYQYPNSYNVTLTVTDASGSQAVNKGVVTNKGAKPTVDFTILSNTGNGNSYTFISAATVTNGSMTYVWDFGDNSTFATIINPTKTFANTTNATISRTVKLTVMSSGGCSDNVSKNVSVYPLPVVLSPNPSTAGTITLSFTAASNTAITIQIYSSNGNIVKSQSVPHSNAAGNNVTVTVSTAGLTHGTYMIRVSDAATGTISSRQILIQ